MDRVSYSARPFVETDYDEVARINAIIEPELPETAQDARDWHDVITGKPGRVMLKFVVQEVSSGTMVAWGGLTHTLWNYHPYKYFVKVSVHPAHRRRGIGQDIYTLLEKEAVVRDAVCLWATARDDDVGSIRFLEGHGFVPLRRTWLSRLDLTNLDLSRLPDRSKALEDQGIRITTLAADGADRPELHRRLYDLVRVASEDQPRMGDFTPATFEEFVAMGIRGPRILRDAIFLASHGEEYVGMSTLEREGPSPYALSVGFTATLPKFRGRGIASELKRRAVQFARAQGYRSLVTGNDSLNPRILAINEKLGFRKEVTWVHAEKALPSPKS